MDNGLIILLVVITLLVILLYWNTRNQSSESDHHSDLHAKADHETPSAAATLEKPETFPGEDPAAEIPTPELNEPTPQAVPQVPDNLTKIEGVGPKIAGLLAEGGIGSFDALAATELVRLEEILEAAGSRYRLADPTSWADQASLAAAGEWDKLAELQEKLSGGRAKKN